MGMHNMTTILNNVKWPSFVYRIEVVTAYINYLSIYIIKLGFKHFMKLCYTKSCI